VVEATCPLYWRLEQKRESSTSTWFHSVSVEIPRFVGRAWSRFTSESGRAESIGTLVGLAFPGKRVSSTVRLCTCPYRKVMLRRNFCFHGVGPGYNVNIGDISTRPYAGPSNFCTIAKAHAYLEAPTGLDNQSSYASNLEICDPDNSFILQARLLNMLLRCK
jgi:hypothetical protein